MIGFPIVDTHLHVWDPGALRYPWLDGNALLNKPYLLADYRQRLRAGGGGEDGLRAVRVRLLPVPAGGRLGDRAGAGPTRASAASCPGRRWKTATPPARPWSGWRRTRWSRASGASSSSSPTPEFCLRPGFVRGVQALPDYGLHFEICISHLQMANAIQPGGAVPGGDLHPRPHRQAGHQGRLLEPWRADLRTWRASRTCGARCRAWRPRPTTSAGPGRT